MRDPAGLEVAQVRGALLSGPQVVDDSDLREALLNRFPGAIAIEMEGEGKVKSYFMTKIHQSPFK